MNVFYYPTALIFYLIGAIVGYHFFDLAAKKSSKRVQILSLVFLIVYILAKNIAPTQMHINNFLIQCVVYTLAAFSLWNVTDLFIEKIKPRKVYRRSFAIYAMHLNVAIIMLKIFGLFIPQNEWLEIPKFILMFVITLLIINLVCVFLEKFAPKINGILFGDRIKK